MSTRIVFGILAALLCIWLVSSGPMSLMVVVVLVAAGLSAMEFDRLLFKERSKRRQLRFVSLVFLAVLTLRSAPEMAWVFLWMPLLVLSVQHVMKANKKGEFERSIRDLAMELLGILYVICMVGFLVPIVESGPNGREYLLLLFFLVFAGDTFAYFVGTWFGKHRLASQISPKKSLEGAAGGVVGALVFAGLWIRFIYTGEVTENFWVKIGVLVPLVSILAQMGDLFESMLKRASSCKDSGHFLPGHGGILDRLDGLTLSAPPFFFFMRYLVDTL